MFLLQKLCRGRTSRAGFSIATVMSRSPIKMSFGLRAVFYRIQAARQFLSCVWLARAGGARAGSRDSPSWMVLDGTIITTELAQIGKVWSILIPRWFVSGAAVVSNGPLGPKSRTYCLQRRESTVFRTSTPIILMTSGFELNKCHQNPAATEANRRAGDEKAGIHSCAG